MIFVIMYLQAAYKGLYYKLNISAGFTLLSKDFHRTICMYRRCFLSVFTHFCTDFGHLVACKYPTLPYIRARSNVQQPDSFRITIAFVSTNVTVEWTQYPYKL